MKRSWENERGADELNKNVSIETIVDIAPHYIADYFSLEKSKIRATESLTSSAKPVTVATLNHPKIMLYSRRSTLSVTTPPVIQEGDDMELVAINQYSRPAVTRINELRSESPPIRTKTPPMAIPRKNTPSPLTVTPVILSTSKFVVGSPDFSIRAPIEFITQPKKSTLEVITEVNKAKALVQKSYIPTLATTPTSTEFLAQETGSLVGIVPGLSL